MKFRLSQGCSSRAHLAQLDSHRRLTDRIVDQTEGSYANFTITPRHDYRALDRSAS